MYLSLSLVQLEKRQAMTLAESNSVDQTDMSEVHQNPSKSVYKGATLWCNLSLLQKNLG